MPVETMSHRDRILEILSTPEGRERSSSDIAREVGCHEGTVRRARGAGKQGPDRKPDRVEDVKLIDLKLNLGTQMREKMDEPTIDHYSDLIDEGHEFPPVDVFETIVGLLLAEGFHRFHAHKRSGKSTIKANIYKGDLRDAMLHAIQANADHPLPRTTETKRRALGTLYHDPEWGQWALMKQAKTARVSYRFAERFAAEMEANKQLHAAEKAEAILSRENMDRAIAPDADSEPDLEREAVQAEANGHMPEAPPKPEAAEDNRSDAEWLTTLPVREKLPPSCQRSFDADALKYRSIMQAVSFRSFQRFARGVLDEKSISGVVSGPYHGRLAAFLRTPHPRDWRLCPTKGGCGGKGTVGKTGQCDKCLGRGFLIV